MAKEIPNPLSISSRSRRMTVKHKVQSIKKTNQKTIAKLQNPKVDPVHSTVSNSQVQLDPHSPINGVVRASINKTAIKRQSFLIRHENLFKPLLPASNYFTKLSKSEKLNAIDQWIHPVQGHC